MKLFSKLFAKSPADLLAKGDRYLQSESYFDARSCYEDALNRCNGDDSARELEGMLKERIQHANDMLAELNLQEAGFSISRGDLHKAVEHLELVKTLTYDTAIREKAEQLLRECQAPDSEPAEPASASACGSCSSISAADCAETPHYDESLPPMVYYDLLIRQLPPEQYQQYSQLGEDFAYAYIAASLDKHEEALSGFERTGKTVRQDIYLCETGKVLHRIGRDQEAELRLRQGLQINPHNSLLWYNLALLLVDGGRLNECLQILDTMITGGIMPEQSMLMRAEILEASGRFDEAIDQCVALLSTPLSRSAAEKLHGILIHVGRHNDAAVIFKKYMGKCCH